MFLVAFYMDENNLAVPINPVCGPTGLCSCMNVTFFCNSIKTTTFPGFLPTESVLYLKLGGNNLTSIWPNAFAANLLEIDAGKNRLAGIPQPPKPLIELIYLNLEVCGFS